ncbi:MAG: tyrosine-type recombinase/integrase [Streptosporangiaceae bacterium]
MAEPPETGGAQHAAAADRLARSAALAGGLPAAFAVTVFDPVDPALAGVFMAGSRVTRLRTGSLPLPMRREISWWIATCYASGERLIHASERNRWVATAADVVTRRPEVCSFADLTLTEWMTAWGRVFHAGHGRIATASSRRRAEIALRGMLRLLAVRYSPCEWWQHDTWSLRLDPRIPRREHESRGSTAVRWSGLQPAWLGGGFRFCLRLQLESGQLTWSSVMPQHAFAFRFAAFLASRSISYPALVADPGHELRALALDFRTFLHGWTKTRQGRSGCGSGLDARTIARNLQAIGLFYRVMSDYRAEAAAALADDRWLALADAHARLCRDGDRARGRAIREADERNYINDTDLARMLSRIELLGLPRDQAKAITRDGQQIQFAGFGHPAVMRAWLIQALTGRRASEVLMMDFEPLSEIPGLDVTTVPEGGMVARLRCQQTKIDGAPDTILTGAGVVQIIREQQAWARQQWHLGPEVTPRCLFPKATGNRHATRPWETSNYNKVLREFSLALGLRDADGQLLLYSRSHRLRHAKATTLLNAGAPIHVVQRYLGHQSPEMSMRYAATLASTAEREFLAMVKIGRDGREIGMDHRDMLDLMQLGRRTDRVLPNGYCLLPPARSCDKGNACHGCGHFATDRTHLPEIRRQLAATEQLIEHREAQHLARYGEPMSERNVWLEQRLAEVRSMRLEIAALEAQPGSDTSAVRGAGVCGRPGYQAALVPVTITRKPAGS